MMTLRELLSFNLFLQLFDGTASYFILSRGEAELNPFVSGAAENVLNDWNVALDDMMECASPTALEAIAVLRDELKLANQDFMVQQ